MAIKLVVFALLAVLLGVVLTLVFIRRRSAGTLKVYVPDDPDESPYLYVELDESIESISKRDMVLFTVDIKALNSQR